MRRVWLDGVGEVLLTKRKGSTGLRLSVNANGKVRVSMPQWVPYRSAISFAKKRTIWIVTRKAASAQILLVDGLQTGKAYRLRFQKKSGQNILKTRLIANKVVITTSLDFESEIVQERVRKACERALLKEAREVLPDRLKNLSQNYAFAYKDLRIRRLTSRWGSCSNVNIIGLSDFLVQLPDEVIDYVLIHELVHTKYLNHSRQFWQTLEVLIPKTKALRRQINQRKPRLEAY